MTVVSWPSHLLPVRSMSAPFLRTFNRTGGRNFAGRRQIVSTGSQVWRLSLTLRAEGVAANIREFRAKIIEMQGMANIAEFDLPDPILYDASIAPLQKPFSTGEFFSTGQGFLDPSGGVQKLEAASAAAAGLSSVTLKTTDPVRVPPRVGDYFSHDYFLHAVTGFSAGVMTFGPALRTAVSAGDQFETAPPRVRMHFASDDEGAAVLAPGVIRQSITLNFVEEFDR